MSLIDLGDGLVVDDESGEVVSLPAGTEKLGFVARKRHEAHDQEKAWGRTRLILDQVLLREQEVPTATYDSVVIRVAGGTYTKTDGQAMADLVMTRVQAAFSEGVTHDITYVVGIIAAATGFKRDALPEQAVAFYDAVTERMEKRPWIESQPVLKRAP